MKFIIGFVTLLVINIQGSLAGDTAIIDDIARHYYVRRPAQLAPPTIKTQVVTADYLSTKVADLKALADTLPNASAVDAVAAFTRLAFLVSHLSNKIQDNLEYYISKEPDFGIEAVVAFGHAITSLQTLLTDAANASGSPTPDNIALIEKDLITFAVEVKVLGNLASQVTNDSNRTAGVSKEFIDFVKVLGDGTQQLLQFFYADIEQMLFNIVKPQLVAIYGTLDMQLYGSGSNVAEQLADVKVAGIDRVYKTLGPALASAFHLFPSKYDYLSTNVLGKESLSRAAVQDFYNSIRPDTSQSISEVKYASLKPIGAVLNLIQSVSSATDDIFEQATPITNLILRYVHEILRYEVCATDGLINWISTILDTLRGVYTRPLIDVMVPTHTECLRSPISDPTWDLNASTDISATYSRIEKPLADAAAAFATSFATLSASKF